MLLIIIIVPGTLWVKAIWTQSQVNISAVCSVSKIILSHTTRSHVKPTKQSNL